MLTHGNFMFELGVAVDELHRAVRAPRTPRPCSSCRWPTSSPGSSRSGAIKSRTRLGHSADIKNLLAGPAGVPADVHPRRAPGLREGLQHRLAAGDRRRPRPDLRPGRRDRDRLLPRPRQGPALAAPCAPGTPSSTGWSTAKLRAALGGHCLYAVSGGAPLGDRLGHFYRGIGLTVLEGYGLTETTAALTVNLPGRAPRSAPWAGRCRGTAVRVADDGELLFRGGQVFAGYWHNEEATAEVAASGDGWFHTGDVGEVDDEGFVRITGRKKEILVTAGGKNVAPAVLEDRLRAHPLVEPVHGGRRRPAVHRRAGHPRPRVAPDLGRAARQDRLGRRPGRRPGPARRDPGARSTTPTRRSPRPSRSASSGSSPTSGPRRAASSPRA